MSSFQSSSREYAIQSATKVVPELFSSSQDVAASKCIVKRALVPNSSGSPGPGGRLLFQISSSDSFAKSGSAYIEMNVVCTFTVSATGAAGAKIGPQFAFPGNSASSLFQRVTLLNAGRIAYQSNFYSHLDSLKLIHNTSTNYVTNQQIMSESPNGVSATWTAAQAAAAPYTAAGTAAATVSVTLPVSVPLRAGIFQADNHLPLFLSQSNMILEIILNGQNAMIANATTGVTFTFDSWRIESANLIFDNIEADPAVVSAIKQRGMYELRYVQCINPFIVADSQNINQLLPLNTNSLRGVAWSCFNDNNSTTLINYSCGNGTIPAPPDLGITYSRLLIDNVVMNSNNFDNIPAQWASVKQFYARNTDVDQGFTPLMTTRALYYTPFFGLYHNTIHTDQEGYHQTGVSCQQAQLIVQKNSASNNVLIAPFVDVCTVLSFDNTDRLI